MDVLASAESVMCRSVKWGSSLRFVHVCTTVHAARMRVVTTATTYEVWLTTVLKAAMFRVRGFGGGEVFMVEGDKKRWASARTTRGKF